MLALFQLAHIKGVYRDLIVDESQISLVLNLPTHCTFLGKIIASTFLLDEICGPSSKCC